MTSMERLALQCILVLSLLSAVYGQTQREKFEARTRYPTECRLTSTGSEYAGNLSVTSGGYQCQSWDQNRPHYNYYKQSHHYPEGNATMAGARCRNPDYNFKGGPWCYTTNRRRRWQLCAVPFCECKELQNGTDFEGTTNRTVNGHSCQRWDSQYPHRHNYTDSSFPENNMLRTKHRCRNPNASPTGPWCYTLVSTVEFESCNVPNCSDINITYIDYTITTTSTTLATTTTLATSTPTTTTVATTTPTTTTVATTTPTTTTVATTTPTTTTVATTTPTTTTVATTTSTTSSTTSPTTSPTTTGKSSTMSTLANNNVTSGSTAASSKPVTTVKDATPTTKSTPKDKPDVTTKRGLNNLTPKAVEVKDTASSLKIKLTNLMVMTTLSMMIICGITLF